MLLAADGSRGHLKASQSLPFASADLDPETGSRQVGLSLLEHGRAEEAVACFTAALKSAPDCAETDNALGVALYELGRRGQALVHFQRALARRPQFAAAHHNVAAVLKAQGRPVEALAHARLSLRLQPEDLRYFIGLAECLDGLLVTKVDRSFVQELVSVFAADGVDHHDLAFAATSILKHTADFERLASYLKGIADTPRLRDLMAAGLSGLHTNPLLLLLLKRTIVRDALFEWVLTRVRRAALQEVVEATWAPPSSWTPFVCALAHQCFANDYVYSVTDQEANEFGVLESAIGGEVEGVGRAEGARLATLACYVSLSDLSEECAVALNADRAQELGLGELYSRQVEEPSRERRLRDEIERRGRISDATSQRVREQYEEHPYPRWLSTHRRPTERLQRLLKRIFPHLSAAQLPAAEAPKVLIAGCGTGKHAINRAIAIQSSRVLAIDLSLSSLCYAKRKADEIGLDNIVFEQSDLLNIEARHGSFDLIECIGVLHHMADPAAGMAALCKLLNPGAYMRIGLYGEAARREIVAAQAYAAGSGYTATPEDIRLCRRDIFTMSEESEIAKVKRIVDFYTLPETRDLLFHVQEHRFTLPEIAAILEDLHLEFVGFEFNDGGVLDGYVERFPDDPTGISLRNWHRYEKSTEGAFPGLYLFWVRQGGGGYRTRRA